MNAQMMIPLTCGKCRNFRGEGYTIGWCALDKDTMTGIAANACERAEPGTKVWRCDHGMITSKPQTKGQ